MRSNHGRHEIILFREVLCHSLLQIVVAAILVVVVVEEAGLLVLAAAVIIIFINSLVGKKYSGLRCV
jgi:hypothetical protein